jgi:hypothetical protein
MVNRLKKTSGNLNATMILFINDFYLELSPDKGWHPRLSLRNKSFSLDTPETSPNPVRNIRHAKDCSSSAKLGNGEKKK